MSIIDENKRNQGPNLQLGCLGFPFEAAATGTAAAALHCLSAANFLINILFLPPQLLLA